MQPDHFLLSYDHVLINVAFITSVLFTPVVSFFWPWWQESWGQNIVALEACIGGTLLSSWLFIDWGISSDVLQWVTASFLTLVVLIIIWRTVMIWHAQRYSAENKRSPAPDGTGDPEPDGEPALSLGREGRLAATPAYVSTASASVQSPGAISATSWSPSPRGLVLMTSRYPPGPRRQ